MSIDTRSSPLLMELAAITEYIGAARSVMKDGCMPDMAVLEKKISDICLGIQAADVEEQSRCLPELAAILRHLDACERDIRAWNDQQQQKAAAP